MTGLYGRKGRTREETRGEVSTYLTPDSLLGWLAIKAKQGRGEELSGAAWLVQRPGGYRNDFRAKTFALVNSSRTKGSRIFFCYNSVASDAR